MANADCIVIEGSNMAECHPVGFQWVVEAKKRGARIIHVDPRYTRTSSFANRHIGIRGGTDVVLLGAVINYMLHNELYFRDYVVAYTNAPMIISADYQDTEELDGLFSGYNPETGTYVTDSWQYVQKPGGSSWNVERDDTLQHPNSVFQILKRHYARYTPQLVEETCGISQEDFYYLADSIAQNSDPEHTTCFAYALGFTQHTLGAQFIRTAAILQLLMGNVGRPGAGIMALRGHASIQGSTDIPTLFHSLPGYLPMPSVEKQTWSEFVDQIRDESQKGFWQIGENYAVSLMKSYWGDAANDENNWGYDLMPRISGAHSTYETLQAMLNGQVDGYFVFGQNPAVAQSNGGMQRRGLASLKWLVVRDFQEIETASFWKDAPEIKNGELKTEDIETEVFLMPAATHVEKAGTFTQTQRMLQWRFQAAPPPGDARSELWFFYQLGKKLKERLGDSTDPRDLPLQKVTWDYVENEEGEPNSEDILKEINGYYLDGPKKGELLPAFVEMKNDGTTSGGCWIYTGVYKDGVNQSARKVPGSEQNEVAPEWGWVWPANRRILYNRASAKPDGTPWSERKKYVWWDDAQGTWVGDDVPDFPVTKSPDYRAPADAVGPDALDGTDAFIMQADGRGWLFAPSGLSDGPLPTHYEPQESPVTNVLYKQQQSPTRLTIKRPDNLQRPEPGMPGAEVFPFVFSTYRLTEMYTSGAMSRRLPFLAELQPGLFCEVDKDLAAKRGLENGEWATIISPRGVIEAQVLVTDRMQMLTINGEEFHQIGLPFHYGESETTAVAGDGANDLLGLTLEPNVFIQNSKIGACDIQPGRRPRGEDRLKLLKQYQERAQLSVDSGNDLLSFPDSFTYNLQPERRGQSGAGSGDDGTASEGEEGK
ncbi:molybdopterin-dependent oxidoreductase [Corynebacterium macginleyi]|uniref:Formate dehydrogenase n=2 Tax=Corynebacterium macginleyi TaxID=38290 RepID=A0A3M0G3B0_9CORY|nr:molybdopterin-dependent oxidoreductase [Corynebacterium macginleyi]MBK4150969.1 molybdopterin-dependent oxidoreductase [Corynebacterium macginleyi]MBK4152792.1 molybdopterin-dependent oxidoreductase [Corynebacterium macginleyi]MBK4168334.1 molybdopterin-dependent oxidoreductase [Corynebacterium macginleyi]MBK4174258.1 molybdopterin-dependent oxidoreductase [Corynebacterium macginleyi]